jgi:phosphomannomutase
LQFSDPGIFLKSTVLGTGNFPCQTRRVEQIKFGTDGWRAVLAKDFTFAKVALADLKV